MESGAMEGSSICFVCQYQTSPDGAFLKHPEGYPFKFLCKFLKLPIRAEKLNFSAISNSEFCVACEQIILEAMELCEKIKDPDEMETQASSLRSYLRSNFSSSNSAMSSGTSVSASKSIRKFLVQCLSESKVVIPRLSEDHLTRYHLPIATYTGEEEWRLREDESDRSNDSSFVKLRSSAQVSRRRLGSRWKSAGTVAAEVSMEPIVILHEGDPEDGPEIADSALVDSDFLDSDPGESDSDTSDDDFVPIVTSTGNSSKRRAPPREGDPPPKRPKYHQCRHCERKFDLKNDLRAHLKLAHDDVILSTCRYCGLDFKEECQIRGKEQREEAEKTFMCGLNGCKRTFKSIPELRGHHQRKCEENPNVKNRIGSEFICEKCGKSYSSQQGLEFHKASKHEENFKMYCEVCGMGFLRPCLLKTHMISHSSEKPFECKVCKERFKRKDQLNYHTRTHTGERLYVCELCGKRFYNNAKLKAHTEGVHGEKKYACELCGKKYRSKKYLHTHVTGTHYGRRQHWKNNYVSKPLNSKAKQTAQDEAPKTAPEAPQTAPAEAPQTAPEAPQAAPEVPRTLSEVSSLSQEAASVVGQGNLSRRDVHPNERNVIAETPRPPDPRFFINPTPVLPELLRFGDHIHALSSFTHPVENSQPSYSFHKFC